MKPVVLLVHRSARQRDAFRRALEQGGFEAYAVPDGRAAITSFPDIEPDVVVLDGVNPMPAVPQFRKELRSLAGRKEIPLVLTNDLHQGEDYTRQAKAAGAAHVLERGFSEDDLVRGIWDLLETPADGRPGWNRDETAWEDIDTAVKQIAIGAGHVQASEPAPGEEGFIFEAAPSPAGRGRDGVRFSGNETVETIPVHAGEVVATQTARFQLWKDRGRFSRPVQLGVLVVLVAVGVWVGRHTASTPPDAPVSSRSSVSPGSGAERIATVAPAAHPALTGSDPPPAPSTAQHASAPQGAAPPVTGERAGTSAGSAPAAPPSGSVAASRSKGSVPGSTSTRGTGTPTIAGAPGATSAAPPAATPAAPAADPVESSRSPAGSAPESATASVQTSARRDAGTEGPLVPKRATVAESDTPASPLSRPVPPYPPAARQQSVRGEVLLQAMVLEDGKVGEVRILRSPSQILSDAAIQAVLKWKYRPATRDGKPVPSWRIEAISFQE